MLLRCKLWSGIVLVKLPSQAMLIETLTDLILIPFVDLPGERI